MFLGVALCNRYPQTAMEFLGRLEAYLMNSNVQSLTLDLIGQFEQSLFKDLNNVRITLAMQTVRYMVV